MVKENLTKEDIQAMSAEEFAEQFEATKAQLISAKAKLADPDIADHAREVLTRERDLHQQDWNLIIDHYFDSIEMPVDPDSDYDLGDGDYEPLDVNDGADWEDLSHDYDTE